jgi:hypothetical protein
VAPTEPAAAAVERVVASPAVTVLAAGDIASCDEPGDEQTVALVASYPGAPILLLGDQAYPEGSESDYASCFEPSWGSFKARIRPVPGNHEYLSSNAEPYFAYFGANAGPNTNAVSRGYYSFDLGDWHIVALNSEQDIGPDGAQLAWLRADLAATENMCVLAYWHRPRFVASQKYEDFVELRPFWEALYSAGAEIVLNGHDHSYQRYGPLTPGGLPDPEGIREFVVGTGGRAIYPIRPDARREAGQGDPGSFGVLKLTLKDAGYEWAFLPVATQAYTDSGSGRCF